MNLDRRLGSQDGDAATLFAAARAFRPSARSRRRALRAFGLPIGLSLFGSGLAHAAYMISSTLKGWGLVAGVVATVGAAGSVTYVVAIAPDSASRALSPKASTKLSTKVSSRPSWPKALPAATATATATAKPPEPSAADISPPADDDVPATLPAPVATRPVPVAVPVARLAMRGQRPIVPRSQSVDSSSRQSPPSASAPSAEMLVERSVARSGERSVEKSVEKPVEALTPPPFPFQAPPPAIAATRSRLSAGPAPSASPGPSSLNGELALVVEAQARLRSGDVSAAFAALDRHQRLYPLGALGEEAELLRVRAYLARGDTGAARRTGEIFLQRHPSSPLVARFRSLMNTLDAPTIR